MATLVVFALEREAKPFRRRAPAGVRVAVCGVGPAAVEQVLPALLTDDIESVLMAGFCGALREGLSVGDVITTDAVIDEHGGSWGTGPIRLLTTDRMIGDPIEKRHLGERHEAAIVDMESATVARICARHGMPFLAIRAVSDEVTTRLSPDLLNLLAGGKVSPLRVITSLIRRPAILREFLRLGRDTKLAANRLADGIGNHLASGAA